MPKPGFAGPERVLPAPEVGQPLANEGLQRLQRVLARDGPAEALERAGVRGESGVHQCDHLLSDRVRRYAVRRGYVDGPAAAEALAVLCVEIPLPAFGLAAVHQHTVTPAHLAIEVLHAQLLAPCGVRGEIAYGAEKVAVIAQVERQAGLGCHVAQRLQHARVSGSGKQQCRGAQPLDVTRQNVCERARVGGLVQLGVMQCPTFCPQRLREVPHGREEERRALLAGGHVGGFFRHLGHPHRILHGIETVEAGGVDVQLIAENDHQMTERVSAHVACRFSCRCSMWRWTPRLQAPCVCGSLRLRLHGESVFYDRGQSNTALRPSCGPTHGAMSLCGRRRRRAWRAGRICCLSSGWGCWSGVSCSWRTGTAPGAVWFPRAAKPRLQ